MILLTGATGYIGGRLLHRLQDEGLPTRCLARNPDRLLTEVEASTELVQGDVLDLSSLQAALQGVETAFYLVHSMGAGNDFAEEDKRGAKNFATAAKEAGVKRIVYVGGLGDSNEKLSEHLRSRHETGEVLRSTGVEVIELRASIVIGSGSLSFEIVRALSERLPAMICPRWVEVQAQPIAIEDLLSYLTKSISLPYEGSRTFEIGGPDVATYGEVMREYMRQRGLKRLMISVPFLTPNLSSLWLGLVTPVYARIGRKLIQSLKNPTVISDKSAELAFSVKPMGLKAAIERALENEDKDYAKTRWSDALSSGGQRATSSDMPTGRRIVDSRALVVPCSASEAFAPIQRIGGDTKWYGDWLWRLRGFIDLLVGGVGVRRGRRHPVDLAVGDALDFWRVEAIKPDSLLRLRAEMKVPGRAWLQFEVLPTKDGTEIRQTATYDPRGLFGLLYWYCLYPLHVPIFKGMLLRIAQKATNSSTQAKTAK